MLNICCKGTLTNGSALSSSRSFIEAELYGALGLSTSSSTQLDDFEGGMMAKGHQDRILDFAFRMMSAVIALEDLLLSGVDKRVRVFEACSSCLSFRKDEL